MTDTKQRVVRIPLPVRLIREMDAVIINEVGGYSTRAEFIVDAIQERILELTIEDAGPPPALPDVGSAPSEPSHANATVRPPLDPDPPPTTELTALTPPEAGFCISATDDLSRPEGKALFGLHNRDYPALWALSRLAVMANEEPIPVEDYFAEVLEEAWSFGKQLVAVERHTGRKCTALFPTNSGKRKSAETAFRSFAVGDCRTDANNTLATSGPLFEWRVAGLVGSADDPRIGLTAAGWTLLAALRGLSVGGPHAPSAATAFLSHLTEHAPADEKGFAEILRVIGRDGATRQDVLDHAASQWPEWTENEVSTNSAGYIARAREWGLIEPKQSKSQYHLTPLGVEKLTEDQQ